MPVLMGPASVNLSAALGTRVSVEYTVTLSQCTPSSTVFAAAWSLAPGSPAFQLDTLTRNTLSLSVLTSSLTPGVPVTVVLNITSTTPPLTASASVVLLREAVPLSVSVVAPLTIGADQALLLRALGVDLDNSSGTSTFAWQCRLCDVGSLTACTTPCGFLIQSASQVTVPANSLLALRAYAFSVTFSKNSLSAQASATVTALAPTQLSATASASQMNLLSSTASTVSVSTACGVVNPSAPVSVTFSAVGGSSAVVWAFSAIQPSGASQAPAVPIATVTGFLQTNVFGATIVLSPENMQSWYGFQINFRGIAQSSTAGSGTVDVCFVIGSPPVLSSFTAEQVEDRIRIVVQSSQTVNLVIGYRILQGTAPYFVTVLWNVRNANYRLPLRTSAGIPLPPCPSAAADIVVYACVNGVCSTSSTNVELSCNLRKQEIEEKTSSVSDCGINTNPTQRLACIVQVAQAAPSSINIDQAVNGIGSLYSEIYPDSLFMLLFSSAYFTVISLGDFSSSANVLDLLLGNQNPALPDTLSLFFQSVTMQSFKVCDASAENTRLLFQEKILSQTDCNSFSGSILGISGISSSFSVAARGTQAKSFRLAGKTILIDASLSTCDGIALLYSNANDACVQDDSYSHLDVVSDTSIQKIVFPPFSTDEFSGKKCARWDSEKNEWTDKMCMKDGDFCSCTSVSAGKTRFGVVAISEKSGSSNKNTSIGIAVGVSVAVVSGALLALFFFKQKSRSEKSKPMTVF
eukprot:TRINITY_DN4190_c0_g1_i3.p2 TRINITY_DN4190_c0_g1~~TRINITY_DN4190_c0_g1_i3.p2  ORF type:complete len:747 (-),score=192.40 TRINITY_DN4190_c0_g1_i3:44-2284(-)